MKLWRFSCVDRYYFQKRKTKLSELIQFVHDKDDTFIIKPYVTQETEYDDMFREMIDRGLFSFMDKDSKKAKESVFLKYDDKWHDVKELKEFQRIVLSGGVYDFAIIEDLQSELTDIIAINNEYELSDEV